MGKVVSLAAMVGYLVAVGARASLWPLAVGLGLIGVTSLVGSAIYREHPGAGKQQVGH